MVSFDYGTTSKVTMNIINSEFKNIRSKQDGGAIYFYDNRQSGDASALTIEGSTFEGCTATKSGGAVAVKSNTNRLDFKLTSTKFTKNKANVDGGALWLQSKVEASLFGALNVFEGNKAELAKQRANSIAFIFQSKLGVY